MYSTDFEYNGRLLSDFNGLICNVTSSGGTDSVQYGTDITWNTVKVGNQFMKTSAVYGEAYSTSFQIAKNNCSDMNDYYFNDREIVLFQRWLRPRTYKRFKPIYDDGSFGNVYYKGIFTTVNPILSSGKVIGFDLTFTANAPFGYLEEVTASADNELTINALMDEYYVDVYPQVTLVCNEAGNLELTNSLDYGHTTKINNVTVGEVITFSGETKQINSISPEEHSTIHDDFNYVYPRIVTDDDSYWSMKNQNVFKTNINATITITYSPPTRVGIM